jgi:hypothetical protein
VRTTVIGFEGIAKLICKKPQRRRPIPAKTIT